MGHEQDEKENARSKTTETIEIHLLGIFSEKHANGCMMLPPFSCLSMNTETKIQFHTKCKVEACRGNYRLRFQRQDGEIVAIRMQDNQDGIL